MPVRGASDASHVGRRQVGERRRDLALDNRAADAERAIAEAPNALADSSGASEAHAFHGRDGAAETDILGAVAERGRPIVGTNRRFDHLLRREHAHRVAQVERSAAAIAARSKASIIADSGKSRCTLVRPALPMAMTLSS